MKKIFTILTLAFALATVSFSAKKEAFTFQGHDIQSSDVFSTQEKTKKSNSSYISYPYFTGSANEANSINKTITKFIDSFDSKNTKYDISYKITGSNAKFISVLFSVRETKTENYESKSYYKAFSFDATNGKELKLKDLFLPGYEDSFKEAINDKIRQLGIPTNDKYKGLEKNQQFYLEDSSLVIFYQPNTITTFADGELFLPFMLTDLIGLLN